MASRKKRPPAEDTDVLSEDEHMRLVKGGDEFCRDLAAIAVKQLRKFRPTLHRVVMAHLQDCTSLYSPYTADRINEELVHEVAPEPRPPRGAREPEPEPMTLFTMTLGGNMFAATDAIGGRLRDLVPYLLQMTCQSPYNHTIAVFRAPLSLIRRLQDERKI